MSNHNMNLKEVADLLYHINSKIVNARWLVLRLEPTDVEIDYINESLELCIQVIKKRLENGK